MNADGRKPNVQTVFTGHLLTFGHQVFGQMLNLCQIYGKRGVQAAVQAA
jgi:hypothetical protein